MRQSWMWHCIMLISATVLFVGPFCGQTPAKDLAAYLDEANRLATEKQLPKAMDALRLGIENVWQRMPLSVVKSALVSEKPKGYGMYEPREGNAYNSGEAILLYLEPVGFEVKKQGEEYLFGLVADFEVTTEGGKVLGGKKKFGRWMLKSRRFNTEFFLDLRYAVTGLEPGSYVIETTLKDLNGPGVTTLKTPIVIK
jgi:hypothetical protein